jgi:hypothetical protein
VIDQSLAPATKTKSGASRIAQGGNHDNAGHNCECENPTQMRLAPDDAVIETLASDRSDQSFGKKPCRHAGAQGQ